MVGADMIVGVDLNPAKEEWGRRFGMTHFVNPKDVSDVVAHLVELTGGGADYTFDCTGNTVVMRQALEACHRGWGESIVIGVAEAGKEIATRPFQLVTGRVWRGSAFGGARGRTDTPKIVDWYMDGKIEIDPMITHTLPLERINEAFDLMHAGESIRSVVVFCHCRPGQWSRRSCGAMAGIRCGNSSKRSARAGSPARLRLPISIPRRISPRWTCAAAPADYWAASKPIRA